LRDIAPLLAAGKPEVREYCAIYCRGLPVKQPKHQDTRFQFADCDQIEPK